MPHVIRIAVLSALIGVAAHRGVFAADESADAAAARKATKDYVAAFNKGNAKALLAAWTAKGEYINAKGEAVDARKQVESEIKARQPDDPPTLTVKITAIRPVSAGVAIVDGTTTLDTESQGTRGGSFSAVWVKQEGKWLLDSLREGTPASRGGDDLKELEWMIGEWSGKNDKASAKISAKWNSTKKFILRDITITPVSGPAVTISQRIGWDPATKLIRSWTFEAEGGYSDGYWTKQHGNWVVDSAGVHPDGSRSTAVNIYSKITADGFDYASLNATHEGEEQPEVRVKFTRSAAK